jgi:uncharacterized protein YaeQ
MSWTNRALETWWSQSEMSCQMARNLEMVQVDVSQVDVSQVDVSQVDVCSEMVQVDVCSMVRR